MVLRRDVGHDVVPYDAVALIQDSARFPDTRPGRVRNSKLTF